MATVPLQGQLIYRISAKALCHPLKSTKTKQIKGSLINQMAPKLMFFLHRLYTVKRNAWNPQATQEGVREPLPLSRPVNESTRCSWMPAVTLHAQHTHSLPFQHQAEPAVWLSEHQVAWSGGNESSSPPSLRLTALKSHNTGLQPLVPFRRQVSQSVESPPIEFQWATRYPVT